MMIRKKQLLLIRLFRLNCLSRLYILTLLVHNGIIFLEIQRGYPQSKHILINITSSGDFTAYITLLFICYIAKKN